MKKWGYKRILGGCVEHRPWGSQETSQERKSSSASLGDKNAHDRDTSACYLLAGRILAQPKAHSPGQVGSEFLLHFSRGEFGAESGVRGREFGAESVVNLKCFEKKKSFGEFGAESVVSLKCFEKKKSSRAYFPPGFTLGNPPTPPKPCQTCPTP